jgi:hypothetical protein
VVRTNCNSVGQVCQKPRSRLKFPGARGVTKRFPYSGPTSIRRHGIKLSQSGDVAPGICALLDNKLPQKLNPQHRNFGITSWYAPVLEINVSLYWLGCGCDDRGIAVRFPGVASDFLLSRHPDRFWDPRSHLFKGCRALFLWVKRPAWEVTSHFSLVPTLQTCGALPPLPTPSCRAQRLYFHLTKYTIMFINASPCWIVCQLMENRNSYFSSLWNYLFSFTTTTTIVTKARQVSNVLWTTSLWFKVPLYFHALCCRY